MSARLLRRLANDRRGSGAVEFALCIPVFLTMIIGVIQFGWTQHTLSSIRYAMQQASRALVIDPTLTQANLQALVDAKLARTTPAKVTVSLAKTTSASGPMATLSVSYVAAFGVPNVAAYRVPYQLSITTALRQLP